MDYQEPAEGIMKLYEHGTSVFYNIKCQCQNPDDELNFELEVDDFNEIMLNTYVKSKTPYWKSLVNDCKYPMFDNSWLYSIDWNIRSIINGLYHRIMVTYEVWIKGYVSYHSTTIMNRQAAYNYAHTILKAIDKIEANHE